MSIFRNLAEMFDFLDVLRQEKKIYKAKRVHIFGSRARGDITDHSDFDLAVDTNIVDHRAVPDSFTKGKRSGSYFDIWREVRGRTFLDYNYTHITLHLNRIKPRREYHGRGRRED